LPEVLRFLLDRNTMPIAQSPHVKPHPTRHRSADSAQDRNIEASRRRIRSPLTAVRAFCVECMGGYLQLIPSCPSQRCPLHPYRMGKNPTAKKRGKPFEVSPESAKTETTRPCPFDSANSEAERLTLAGLAVGRQAP
jgi:hypothetical protein